jgi:hypothetical protein
MATGTFMVECYWPAMTEDVVRDILRRVGRTRRRRGDEGIRQLGSFLVPADGMVIFLFEGASPAAIRAAATLAEVPFDRIVEFRSVQVSDPGN